MYNFELTNNIEDNNDTNSNNNETDDRKVLLDTFLSLMYYATNIIMITFGDDYIFLVVYFSFGPQNGLAAVATDVRQIYLFYYTRIIS